MNLKYVRKALLMLSSAVLVACSSHPEQVKDSVAELPPIFPDYAGVTIPTNIAPLNFMIEGVPSLEAVFMRDGKELLTVDSRKGVVDIPISKWHDMIKANEGGSIQVKVRAWGGEYPEGVEYAPFDIHISTDEIDGWVAYRLIEPGYEGWLQMGIYQRELASFNEEVLVDNSVNNMGCVNCHSFCSHSPQTMMFHSRSDNGGTVFWQDGQLEKINLAAVGPKKQGTYPRWNPKGRYVAYSSNLTFQSFYAEGSRENETYDTASDLIILDTESGKVLADERFNESTRWETYPEWSPDGEYIYFCSANGVQMPNDRRNLHYDLLRVKFDRETMTLGEQVDTVYNTRIEGGSVGYPRISPDGQYLMYARLAYGTFPVWHEESDMEMVRLADGQKVDVSAINSDDSESYHSWSSTSRWKVVASRRLDSRYARVYIAHISEDGVCGKPFLLPQRNPLHNMWRLKSYNIPEFVTGKVSLPKERLMELLDAGTGRDSEDSKAQRGVN
ncbi:MAG: PD40 domain-containing protein [Alistipes sp.]|nr:PD40 domain-containing protein [Alistipes sp.]